MAVDGRVTIGVEIDSETAKKELGSLGNDASSGLEKTGEKIKSAITKAVAALATGAVTKSIIETGAQFESTMSNVQAISGATADEMERLSEAAKDMGAKSSFSATESAEALTYMGMAGWKTDQMIAGLPGIMNLAAASGEDLATTSDIVTDALTAFGKGADESSIFADVLAAASSNANTNVSMLGESFKYVAPVAGSLGMNYQDISIALGLMANSGIKAGQAGTSLRTALTRMVKPTKQSGEAMEALGLSITNQDGSMKSMAEIMDMLRDKMGGLSEAEQAEYAALLFGQEAMSGMLAIVNASDEDYDKLTEAIYESAGAAETMANTRLDNFQGQVTLLKSALEGFGLSIYEKIADPLMNLATVGTEAVTRLTDAFKTGGIEGMTLAGMSMIQNLMAGITEQIPMITAKAGEIVSGFISLISESAPLLITSAADMIAGFVTGIGEQLPNLIPQALAMVVTIADALISNIPKIVDAGINLLKGLVTGIVKSMPLIIKEGPRIINSFADAVYSGLWKLIKTGWEMIKQLAQGIKDNLPLIKQNAWEIFLAILNVMSLSKMLSLGKSLMTNLGSGIKNMIPKIGATAKSLAKSALDAIKSVDWLGTGGSVIEILGRGIMSMLGLLKGAALNCARGALTAIMTLDVKSIGINIIKGIMSGVTAMAGQLASKAKEVVKGAVDGVKNFLGIHSPSRLMRDEVGHQMTAGIEVAWESDEDSLKKTAENTMEGMTDYLAGIDFYAIYGGMDFPDIDALTGTASVGSRTGENSVIMKQMTNDTSGFREATRQAISDGMKNLKVYMEGREVGHIVTPYVNREMPNMA